ncbi:MAG: DUF748 domain-containing protein [Bacteroidia bacterium]
MNLKGKKRWKKIVILFSLIVIIFITLVILFISPIGKYLVEKYDVKYLGREITMDRAYVNPFTGYVHFSNVKIYEQNSDTVFFSAKGISANFSMSKLLSKTYEIEELVLDEPKGIIINSKKHFNFSDIIDKFSPKDKPASNKGPVHFNILNIAINNGEFYYHEPEIPVNYSLLKVNLKSGGKYWNSDTINGKISFHAGVGTGDVDGNFVINTTNLDYRFSVKVKTFSFDVIEQYLKDLSNYGTISASLDADMRGTGNFKNEKSIDVKGKMMVNNFHFGKNPGNDYVSYDKLTLVIEELAPENKKYYFDSILLDKPYFKYERYDHLDNIQRMFGKKGSKVKSVNQDPEKYNIIIELAKYIRTIFENLPKSDYKVNRLAVNNGNILFNDYSINEKFSASLEPLNIFADSVSRKNDWISVTLKSGIKPYGSISAWVRMAPKNNSDFDMNYKLQNIPVAVFNPYTITYTSFPLDRGVIELHGNWSIRNNIIQSTNHFLAVDPRLTKKIKKEDSRWIPMPLIMAFVRERGNVIDYEIPITGNLKDPTFHFSDVILDIVKNIFVKPPTTPYRIEVRNTENEVEKSLSLTWATRKAELSKTQGKFVNKIVDFLKDNPDAKITIQPYDYDEKEKEYILFFEAKKKYFFDLQHRHAYVMTEDDSLSIDKMFPKDSNFVHFLDKNIKDSSLFTIQEKCYAFVGKTLIDKKFEQLKKERKEIFLGYFKKENREKQVEFTKSKNEIPFNGFSYYKIKYKGEIPKSLLDAFQQLYEINTEPPRDKYLKFRDHR